MRGRGIRLISLKLGLKLDGLEFLWEGLGLLWKGLGLLLRQFTVLLHAAPNQKSIVFWTSENSKPRILEVGLQRPPTQVHQQCQLTGDQFHAELTP